MKRALILAYYFPPIAASGSLRPLGFCQHMEEHGYLPHVVSTNPEDAHPPVSQDSSLMERIPESVRVDRLEHPNRLKQLLALRDRVRGIANNNRTNEHGSKSVGDSAAVLNGDQGESLFSRLKDAILNRIFLFPDHQKPWIKAVEKHVAALPADQRPDIIFATGNPWSALVAGAKVAKKLGVPFVADFRDPWTRNPKPAVSPALHELALVAERKVVESAAVVVANTDELRQQFVRDYPAAGDRIVTITNAYSDHLIEFFHSVPEVPESPCLELSHFGSVYELRKPDKLLSAVYDLVEQGRVKTGKLKLRFIGHWGVEDSECNRQAEWLESRGFISREPAVAHKEYLVALKQAKCLLVLQQDFPLQIPGKLYEYIATGRPLLMIGGDGATAKLIKENELGMTAQNDIQQLKDLILALLAGDQALQEPVSEQVAKFSYSRICQQLAVVFDRVLA